MSKFGRVGQLSQIMTMIFTFIKIYRNIQVLEFGRSLFIYNLTIFTTESFDRSFYFSLQLDPLLFMVIMMITMKILNKQLLEMTPKNLFFMVFEVLSYFCLLAFSFLASIKTYYGILIDLYVFLVLKLLILNQPLTSVIDKQSRYFMFLACSQLFYLKKRFKYKRCNTSDQSIVSQLSE